MSSLSSSPFPIRFACRAAVVGLAAVVVLWPRPGAAQEEARVTEELARLLAAADTRVYDSTLFAAALRDTDPFVRRQAALAAGRIGDSAAVGQLIAALADRSEEHTSELQSRRDLVCRLLLEKKKSTAPSPRTRTS